MRNELGNVNKLENLWQGKYAGYEGYYNFYNWGVSDSCVTESGTTFCGLEKAKKEGWYGLEKAIVNGADTISAQYIQVGQYNNYFQKFNIVPTDESKRLRINI